MPESSVAVAPSCRSVTAEEIAHYQEFGWVKLKGFVEPETVRFLLETARQRMGEDGDSTEGISQPYFTVGYSGGPDSPPIRALLEGVGKSARQLLRRGAHVGVRYFSDFFAPKLPAAKKTRNRSEEHTSELQSLMSI